MNEAPDLGALRARLEADDRSARRTAAARLGRLLGEIEDPAPLAPLLERALADVDPAVRRSAVEALAGGAARHPALVARLVESRLSEDEVTLRRALAGAFAAALVSLGLAPAAHGVALHALGDPDAEVRAQLVGALARVAEAGAALDAWLDALVTRLDDPVAAVRGAAMRALLAAARRDAAHAVRIYGRFAAQRRRAEAGGSA